MQLPRLAIKNAQFTITIVVLMVLVGIVSYFTMPRSEDPQFDLPITLIEVIYPGASPRDIETLVVAPLEDEIADIEDIKKIETQIDNGTFVIDDQFEDVHSKIEFELTKTLGEVGKKIHTARSRNDQVLVTLQLYYKENLGIVKQKTQSLFETLE